MTSSLFQPLEGIVKVRKFTYGSPEADCQSRSHAFKKLKVCVATKLVRG